MKILVAGLSCLFLSFANAPKIESVYTELASKKCRTIKVDRESGSSIQRCPGVGGYSLLIEDDDSRQSVTVVTPDDEQHPLKYWETITLAFSQVGDQAEWRVVKERRKVIPVALIVRVNAHEEGSAPDKVRSYLAVAKITQQKICVTDKIRAGAGANEEARRAADASGTKACLQKSL